MLKELAKLQTHNRNCLKQIKKQDSLLRERDEKISALTAELVNLKIELEQLKAMKGKSDDKKSGNTRKK
jgi:hypothetical protein